MARRNAALPRAGCRALGADEQDGSPVGGQLTHELQRVLVHRQGLFQVDDVDLVAVAEDERRHLRVPVAGLVSEMDARLQHLTHRDRHTSLLRVMSAARIKNSLRSTLEKRAGKFGLQNAKPAQNSSIISDQCPLWSRLPTRSNACGWPA